MDPLHAIIEEFAAEGFTTRKAPACFRSGGSALPARAVLTMERRASLTSNAIALDAA
jgi:hypothetical protein